jgi:hypothetical protein
MVGYRLANAMKISVLKPVMEYMTALIEMATQSNRKQAVGGTWKMRVEEVTILWT